MTTDIYGDVLGILQRRLDVIERTLEDITKQTRYYYYSSGVTQYRADTLTGEVYYWDSGDDSVGLAADWQLVTEG